jgi:hypothetical protein
MRVLISATIQRQLLFNCTTITKNSLDHADRVLKDIKAAKLRLIFGSRSLGQGHQGRQTSNIKLLLNGSAYAPGLSIMVRDTVRGRTKATFEAAGAKVIVPRQNILSGPLSLQTFVNQSHD